MPNEGHIPYFRRMTFNSGLPVQECVRRLREVVDSDTDKEQRRPPSQFVGVVLPDAVEIYVRRKMPRFGGPHFVGTFSEADSGAELSGYFGFSGAAFLPLLWPVGFGVALGLLYAYVYGTYRIPLLVVAPALGLLWLALLGILFYCRRSDLSVLHGLIVRTMDAEHNPD